jgi:hypothetical protein
MDLSNKPALYIAFALLPAAALSEGLLRHQSAVSLLEHQVRHHLLIKAQIKPLLFLRNTHIYMMK